MWSPLPPPLPTCTARSRRVGVTDLRLGAAGIGAADSRAAAGHHAVRFPDAPGPLDPPLPSPCETWGAGASGARGGMERHVRERPRSARPAGAVVGDRRSVDADSAAPRADSQV